MQIFEIGPVLMLRPVDYLSAFCDDFLGSTKVSKYDGPRFLLGNVIRKQNLITKTLKNYSNKQFQMPTAVIK